MENIVSLCSSVCCVLTLAKWLDRRRETACAIPSQSYYSLCKAVYSHVSDNTQINKVSSVIAVGTGESTLTGGFATERVRIYYKWV